MIIAAHIFAATPEESSLYHCLRLLAEEKQDTRFIFFVDEKWKAITDLPVNTECKAISPAPKNGLLLHYWYSFKLPALLKKYQVTHFVSESGAISLKVHIPQFLWLNDISFLQKKPVVVHEYARYIKRYFPKFINKVAAILVTENFLGDRLPEKFPAAKEKIQFAGHGLDNVYQPIDREEKEKFLEKFTGGTEYFIAECSVFTQSNILALVKAFSHFKKRQKSAMQLVLVLKGLSINECIKDFHLYKYREDVKIVSYTNGEEYATILAASYGAVYLPKEVIAENSGLHALAAGIPLITTEGKDSMSVYGEAALYTNLSEKMIAENMMLLYKDEELRKNCIEKGLTISADYNWESAAKKLWQLF
jgi:glycosyltransferase involved in cell wall biosynthesis